MSWFLVLAVGLNLIFSTICDILSKYWGITNNIKFLYVGLTLNLITAFFYMFAVKVGGLAITTSIMLLLTMAISVSLGFIFFHEQVSTSQWVGIILGFFSVVLISGVFRELIT